MSWVSPIKDRETLQEFENGLKAAGEKYYVLFEMGLGTGLKLQDILDFRNEDVRKKEVLELNIGKKNSRRSFRGKSSSIRRERTQKPGFFPEEPDQKAIFPKSMPAG